MPQVWAQFISSDENKGELAEYLSERLIDYGSSMEPTKEIITAGGFENPQTAKTTRHSNIFQLEANHEEPDTRLILHPAHAIRN